MASKKILITGAAGFIGHHLANKLRSEGHTVIGVDNFDHPCGAPAQCVHMDVRDPALKELIKDVDEVYHLAAQIHVDRSYEDPELTYDVNVGGTKNVLDACKEYNKTMLLASSVEVYGSAKTPAISEDHPLHPQSPYAESKRQAEELCKEYARKYGVKVKIMRSFNTYGPYQNSEIYGSVIPIFVRRILNGEPPVIFGSGIQTRDFMHISDALNAYELMITKGPIGEPTHFGTGSEISINELADVLINLIGKKMRPVYSAPRPDEVMRLRANITKAESLGFKPAMALEQGLKHYVEWFMKHRLGDSANVPSGLYLKE
ncbi:GDP-mannose 4,6-dehydratase [Candidatus Pacearchaeota archaeon]|nr:GDP-mannose 4,6-dehydratase [Candidatus Pacearchaeota archaeon]